MTLVDSRSGRASSRTLADGEALVRRYADACEDTDWGTVATSLDGGVVRFTRDNGGYVSNSYGRPAETDELHVMAAERRVVVLVSRVRASSRPYGKGKTPDALPRLGSLDVLRSDRPGGCYLSAWVVAAGAQARLEHLFKNREACTPGELVELDSALGAGII